MEIITRQNCCERIRKYAWPAVIFPARFFDELAGLQGDVGAREVLRRNASDVLALEFSEGAVDIDRPEDLQLAPR